MGGAKKKEKWETDGVRLTQRRIYGFAIQPRHRIWTVSFLAFQQSSEKKEEKNRELS